jgi:hypothetical protein
VRQRKRGGRGVRTCGGGLGGHKNARRSITFTAADVLNSLAE